MPENRHYLEKALAADKRSPEHVHKGVSRPYAGRQGCHAASDAHVQAAHKFIRPGAKFHVLSHCHPCA